MDTFTDVLKNMTEKKLYAPPNPYEHKKRESKGLKLWERVINHP